MTTQTRFTRGKWSVDKETVTIPYRGECCVAAAYCGTKENAALVAAAPRLYAALEALTEWHAWSLEYSEEAAAEFYRETGMLAPFKDAGAIANMAEELHASRAEEWRAWCKRKNDALVSEARAALAQARGEP